MAFRQISGVGVSLALRVSRNGILETEIRKGESQHALVMLAGELDTSTVPQLYEELAGLTREGVRHIAIDLAELDFADSTGLSALIAAHKRAEAMGGELILFSPNRDIRRLFEVTGIDSYFNLKPPNGRPTPPT
jgi:anti-sigma B factor antagonist